MTFVCFVFLQEGSEKSAEMTAVAGSSHTRPTSENSYDNQRGDNRPPAASARPGPNSGSNSGSSSGYSLYSGTSMSYSQIADAKNIDSVKVSLVI